MLPINQINSSYRGRFVSEPPRARLRKSASQTIANGAAPEVAFDTIIEDNAGLVDAAFPARLYAPTAGTYFFYGAVTWAANATGVRHLIVEINGGANVLLVTAPNAGASVTLRQAISGFVTLAAGDYLSLFVTQDSGGNLNLTSESNYSPQFGVVRIGD